MDARRDGSNSTVLDSSRATYDPRTSSGPTLTMSARRTNAFFAKANKSFATNTSPT